MAVAMPEIRPPPPTGTMTASRFATCWLSSRPTVAVPAKVCWPSKGCTIVLPSLRWSSATIDRNSAISSPKITSAPNFLQRSTRNGLAVFGITTFAEVPSLLAANAVAMAWFPAENAVIPRRFSSSLRCMTTLIAPRGLKLPVFCSSSIFR